jgi:negative regulator of sigma E activity
MSDHQSKENLSAWIDGELDHARASALPNQILQSAEMR